MWNKFRCHQKVTRKLNKKECGHEEVTRYSQGQGKNVWGPEDYRPSGRNQTKRQGNWRPKQHDQDVR